MLVGRQVCHQAHYNNDNGDRFIGAIARASRSCRAARAGVAGLRCRCVYPRLVQRRRAVPHSL